MTIRHFLPASEAGIQVLVERDSDAMDGYRRLGLERHQPLRQGCDGNCRDLSVEPVGLSSATANSIAAGIPAPICGAVSLSTQTNA